MLTEKRQEEIIKLVEARGSITVQELTEYFHASESTIRRDLNVLDKKGALVKVFGGAVQNDRRLTTREEKVSLRMELHREEKLRIGSYAASLIEPEDFIYLDAGTTTGAMIKECAMKHTRNTYVLCDHSKFHQITPVSFGEFSSAQILTDRLPDESYQGTDNLTVISERD